MAPSPATPSARNVVPPRNVPAAASGNPCAFAAIPAARFSSSETRHDHGEEKRRNTEPAGGDQKGVEEELCARDDEHEPNDEHSDADPRRHAAA